MNDAPDIPARYQVAEAGFGAMMERHGFKLVPNGRCHWRRDGDRVTWRVAIREMNVGTDDGDWVEVYSGVYVHGLDEIYSKLGRGILAETMKGTRAKVHLQDALDDTIVSREKVRWEYETYGRKSWLGKLFYQLHPIPRQDFGDWLEIPCFDRVPFRDYFGFNLSAHGAEILGPQLAHLFETYEIPSILKNLTLEGLYDYSYGPNSHMKDLKDPERYIMAYLAGDMDFFHQMARAHFASDNDTFEEIKAENRESRKTGHDYQEIHQLTEDEFATIRWLGRKMWNRHLLTQLRTLDLPVEDPGIDFSLLEQAEKDWGPKRYPDLETRGKLKAQGIDWALPYRP